MKRLSLMLVAALMATFMLAAPASAAPPAQNLLNEIPVEGTIPGGTFEGVLTITELTLDEGQLLASGVLEGTADVGGILTEITQIFTDLPVSLLNPDAAACDILFLDIGPIFLDLLGLQVDLSQITLDVDAVPGAGNLLGNLLCAVAGLLDGPNPIGNLLNNLLGIINDLLG